MKTTAIAVTTALSFFVLGNVLIFLSPDLFTQYFYDPRLVAIAHVFTIGWVSLMIVGVLRQLAPVAFGVPIESSFAIGLSVAFWIPGMLAMVTGFWFRLYPLAGVGTLQILAAVIVFTHTLGKGFAKKRGEPPHLHVFWAVLYLAAAALLGSWMGLAKGFGLALPVSLHRMLFAHIHLAAVGWVGLMIFGVLSRLFPQPYLNDPRGSHFRFVLLNVGLCGLAAGLVLGAWWTSVFGGLLALMCLWYVFAFVPVLWRFRTPRERSTWFLVASLACFGLTAILGIVLAGTRVGQTEFGMRLQFVYGFVYLFGWVSLMIVGMLYRIVPTHISKLLASRCIQAPPSLRALLENTVHQTIVLVLLLSGLAVASAGILRADASFFRLGWTLWLGGLATFLAGLVRLGLRARSQKPKPEV